MSRRASRGCSNSSRGAPTGRTDLLCRSGLGCRCSRGPGLLLPRSAGKGRDGHFRPASRSLPKCRRTSRAGCRSTAQAAATAGTASTAHTARPAIARSPTSTSSTATASIRNARTPCRSAWSSTTRPASGSREPASSNVTARAERRVGDRVVARQDRKVHGNGVGVKEPGAGVEHDDLVRRAQPARLV